MRIEAQQYLVHFKEYIDLRFLIDVKYDLSYWDYMRLYSTLKNTDEVTRPQYDHLLYSKNETVVRLGVLLIRYFKQMQCAPSLTSVLMSMNKSVEVQKDIIESLLQLEYIEGKDKVIELYPECNEEVKCKILEFVGMIGDDENVAFLKKELTKEKSSNEVKLQAGLAMKKVSRAGEFILSQLLSTARGDDQKIIQHALDRRIQ